MGAESSDRDELGVLVAGEDTMNAGRTLRPLCGICMGSLLGDGEASRGDQR